MDLHQISETNSFNFLDFLIDIHLFIMNNYLIMGSLEYQFKRTLIISSLSDVLKI